MWRCLPIIPGTLGPDGVEFMESKGSGQDLDCAGFTWVVLPPEEQAGLPLGPLCSGLSDLYPGPTLATWMSDSSALPGGPLSLVGMGTSASVLLPSAHRRPQGWHKDGVRLPPPCGSQYMA